MQEGFRNQAGIAIYTDDDLVSANEEVGKKGDVVVHENEEWEVQSIERFTHNLLTHVEAIATRKERTK